MKTANSHAAGVNVLSSLVFAGALSLAASANAASVFFDDFEDGDHAGWLVTDTGRAGSTGVETNNASQMAFAQQTGATTTSLSRDFSYVSDQMLSFTMQAVAIPNFGASATSGVAISFLNLFNQTLGFTTIANATDPGSLGVNDVPVDQLQHDYIASFSDWAGQAGLAPTDPIAKMSLNFFATGASNPSFNSSSKVWFDDVNVSPVPEPAAAWLFSVGLMVVGLKKFSKRDQSD